VGLKLRFEYYFLETTVMDSRGNKCCIAGCTNIEEECSSVTKFYRFPNDDNPVSSIQRSMWVEAIQNGRYVSEGQGDLELRLSRLTSMMLIPKHERESRQLTNCIGDVREREQSFFNV